WQPSSSTLTPAGVLGHRSLSSLTPSPSASLGSEQPLASTLSPAGVSLHWSASSSTPSPSPSLTVQPLASTLSPAGVFLHSSAASGTPSPSLSRTLAARAPPSMKLSPGWMPQLMLSSAPLSGDG